MVRAARSRRGPRNLTGNRPEAAAGPVDNVGMDRNEAGQLLEAQLEEWRRRPYAEVSREVGRWRRFETRGPSGERYEGVIQVFWLGAAEGPVKVVGSIDDGGWRTFVPVIKDFTVMPAQALPRE